MEPHVSSGIELALPFWSMYSTIIFGPSTVSITKELIALPEPHIPELMQLKGVQPSSGFSSL